MRSSPQWRHLDLKGVDWLLSNSRQENSNDRIKENTQ